MAFSNSFSKFDGLAPYSGMLVLLLSLSGTCSWAASTTNDHRAELQVGVGQYFFDSDRNIDDATALNLGLGYVLNENWTLEGVLADFTTETDVNGIDIDGRHYRLDGLYHFAGAGRWQPFLVGGLGDIKFDPDLSGSSRETLLNFGVGAKYLLSRDWQLRGDVRAYNSLDEEQTDFGINLGLSYLLGTKTKAVKAAPVEPMPKAPPSDRDGDGVYDSQDRCSDTPAGAAVDRDGCPLDSDGDGVHDYRDQCPATAANFKVDTKGCPQTLSESVSIELKVNFDSNSSVVKPEYFSEIRRVADFMGQYLNTIVTIEGHTDSRGAASYNQMLSQKRAQAVAKVIVDQFSIEGKRVKAIGYGESRPIADDGTNAGRLANRRVVAKIETEIKKQQTRN